MNDPTKPFGYTVFCDDIRVEVDAKFSYIGCYNGVMVVPSFPVTIPKFGFGITFIEPMPLAFERDFPVSISIYLPGVENDVPFLTSEIAANKELYQQFAKQFEAGEEESASRFMRFVANLMAAPLVIQKAGPIRVRANYNGEILKLGAARVMLNPSQNKVASTA